jgi:uncharacterized YigZ family protein
MSHSYLSISRSGESLYKVKGSKHLGHAFAANDEAEIQSILDQLRKSHYTANHVCYAWRLGINKERYRANDDGEPANSAGMPILGQIEKYDLSDVLIAVVRYFGGTKLGVGGLIDAYRTAAQLAIENAEIVERKLMARYRLQFTYERMGDVMLALRTQGWESTEHDFRERCALTVSLSPEKDELLYGTFAPFNDIRITHIGTY